MEYSEEQVRCYPYKGPDGSDRWADPLLAHRHLVAVFEGDIPRACRELRSDNAGVKFQATAAARYAVSEAFGLAHFTPEAGGATAAYCLALLADFLNWVTSQKKSGGTTPDCSSAG